MKGMIFASALLLFWVLSTPAGGEDRLVSAPEEGSENASSDRHLYLYEKNPDTWRIVKNGAWAKLTFNERTTKFTPYAKGLMPGAGYALIRATGPRPFAHVVARGKTDRQGNLRLSGSWPEWTLRFWLVKGEDVQGRAGDFGSGSLDPFKAWNPKLYLFESEVL